MSDKVMCRVMIGSSGGQSSTYTLTAKLTFCLVDLCFHCFWKLLADQFASAKFNSGNFKSTNKNNHPLTHAALHTCIMSVCVQASQVSCIDHEKHAIHDVSESHFVFFAHVRTRTRPF